MLTQTIVEPALGARTAQAPLPSRATAPGSHQLSHHVSVTYVCSESSHIYFLDIAPTFFCNSGFLCYRLWVLCILCILSSMLRLTGLTQTHRSDPPQLPEFAWSHQNVSFQAQQPSSLFCGPMQDVPAAFSHRKGVHDPQDDVLTQMVDPG